MNRVAFIVGGLLAGLLFVSCRVTGPYTPPQTETEGLFRDQTFRDTQTIASIPWRQFFADTLLLRLIAEGVETNYDLRTAVLKLREAEISLKMARSAFFPSLSLAGQVQHKRSSGPSGSELLKYHTNQFTLDVVSTWEADIWGKLRHRSKAAYARFWAGEESLQLVQTSLIANIALSYYTLLALDRQLEITEETVKLLQKSAEAMEAMMQAGMLNGAAVQQSRALWYSTEAGVPDLKEQIRSLENSLSVLLGRKPGAVERSVFAAQELPGELKYGVPLQMLANRPDLRQAEWNVREAFELTRASRAALYPSLTLNTGSMAGYTAERLSHFFKPEYFVASVIGGLTFPVFAQKQLKGNLRIAEAQQEEALLAFEKALLEAGQEVSDILYTYEAAQEKALPRSRQIEALTTAVEFTQELLAAGEANYTEVLSAQQNLLQAQLNQVNDALQQLQAAVNLYRALGGGRE